MTYSVLPSIRVSPSGARQGTAPALIMPSANFTIDDTSPLIQYAGIWRAGNDTVDPLGHLRVTLVAVPLVYSTQICTDIPMGGRSRSATP